VQTAQVAPTLLKALGLNPQSLEAVRMEGRKSFPTCHNMRTRTDAAIL